MNDSKNMWWKRYRGLIFVLLLVLVLCTVSIYSFGDRLRNVVTKKDVDTAKDISKYVKKVFGIKITDLHQTLEGASGMIEGKEELLSERMMEKLGTIEANTGFYLLGAMTADGQAMNTREDRLSVKNEQLKQAMQAGERYVSDMIYSSRDQKELILVAVPVICEGEMVGSVYGWYDTERLLSEMDFSESDIVYFQVGDSEGKYIMKSKHKSSLSTDGTEIWSELERYEYESPNVLKQVRDDVEHGKSGSFVFRSEGQSRFTIYEPVGINNWYLFTTVDENEIDSFTALLEKLFLVLGVIMTVGCFLIFLSFYLTEKKHRKFILKQNAEIQTKKDILDLVLVKTKDIPFIIDLEREELQVLGRTNDEYGQIFPFNCDKEGVVSRTYFPVERDREQYVSMCRRVKQGERDFFEIMRMHLDDRLCWVKIQILPDGGEVYQGLVLGVIEDYEEQKQKEAQLEQSDREKEQLTRQAQKDALTGLLNRQTIKEWIDTYLKDYAEQKNYHAFLILDLDRFKEINDTFGHMTGDEVLQDTARLLSKRLRTDDLIGRLGGDEFLLFLKHIPSMESIEHMANEINQILERTYERDGVKVSISASIGIAEAFKDGNSFEELYAKADIALYEAKRNGRNRYCLYTESAAKQEAQTTSNIRKDR